MAPTPRSLAACLLAALVALAARPGQAAPDVASDPGAPPTTVIPLAPPAGPRALLASPLVTIERIDGVGAGVLGGATGVGADGQVPIYLLDPEGFTTFGQVAPPDGGHLIMLVE